MKTAREILCKVTGHSDDKLDSALIYTEDALNAMKEYAEQFIYAAVENSYDFCDDLGTQEIEKLREKLN